MVMRLSIILTTLLAVGLPFAAAVPASAQQDYPMTCRIGSMNAAVVAPGENLADVSFERSNGPASSGLQPGQCAFEDRAVRASEPSSLCFQAAIFWIKFNGAIATPSFTGPGAALLTSAVSGPTKLMTFSVHSWNIPNLTGTCFQIDTFGP